jgi:hypothetical protein
LCLPRPDSPGRSSARGKSVETSLDAAGTSARATSAKALVLSCLALAIAMPAAETGQVRGKRVIDEAVAALGGRNFLEMRDRTESGRAYQFYREQLSGLAVAHIYTRYLTRPEPPVPGFLGIRERESFGKDKTAGAVIFNEEGKGFELSWRGARPLPDETLARYRDTTLHNVLYILRMRLGEPGLTFFSQGSDVRENQPVEIVDITDNDNRTVTVYFNSGTRQPVYQVFKRRNSQDNQWDTEVTRFSKYRDIGGGVMWPFAVERERNGDKIFEMYADSITVNKDLKDDLFTLPVNMKILKKGK